MVRHAPGCSLRTYSGRSRFAARLNLALGLMSLKFSQLEVNLRRAGVTLLLTVLGGILLGVALPFFGLDRAPAVLFVWIANLPAVWLLAQAAKYQ